MPVSILLPARQKTRPVARWLLLLDMKTLSARFEVNYQDSPLCQEGRKRIGVDHETYTFRLAGP